MSVVNERAGVRGARLVKQPGGRRVVAGVPLVIRRAFASVEEEV